MDIQRYIANMTTRQGRTSSQAIKQRPLVQTLTVCSLMLVALLMMFMHHRDNNIVSRSRAVMQDALMPVVHFLSTPAQFMASISERAKDVSLLYTENKYLRMDNDRLLQWQNIAKHLESENKELRGLLGLPAPKKSSYISARIIGKGADLKSQTIIVSHDYGKKLKVGYAVITAQGLLGRIIESSQNTAHILLLGDHQSRLPVKHEATSMPAILSGSTDGSTYLKFVENPDSYTVGDRILSGNNEHFPSNLVIGEVSAIRKNMIKVTPYANTDTISFVSIIIPPETQAANRK